MPGRGAVGGVSRVLRKEKKSYYQHSSPKIYELFTSVMLVSCDGECPPHPRQIHSRWRTRESGVTPAHLRVALRPALTRTVSGGGHPEDPGVGVGSLLCTANEREIGL